MRINPVSSAQYYPKPQKSSENKICIVTQNKSNNVAFTGFLSIFDAWNSSVTPLKRFMNLVEEAQNHFKPLSSSIYRGDFKEKIEKGKMLEILTEQRDKAEMTGTKERYQRLIDKIEKEY